MHLARNSCNLKLLQLDDASKNIHNNKSERSYKKRSFKRIQTRKLIAVIGEKLSIPREWTTTSDNTQKTEVFQGQTLIGMLWSSSMKRLCKLNVAIMKFYFRFEKKINVILIEKSHVILQSGGIILIMEKLRDTQNYVYNLSELIGKGATCEVYRGVNKVNEKPITLPSGTSFYFQSLDQSDYSP